jgi:hypothetical protein
MAREQVVSDEHVVTGTPLNVIPALRVCYDQTVTSCVQCETLNLWQPTHHSVMKRGLFCLVDSRPKLYSGLWEIRSMGLFILG